MIKYDSVNHHIYFLFLLLIVVSVGCNTQSTKNEFDWTATLSAAQEYPMEVYKGDISGKDFGQQLTHFGPIAVGWGSGSGTISTGTDLKQLPDYLRLTWISFTEGKVYSGDFQLPKAKILQLFKTGFTDEVTKRKDTYNTFMIGLAPKGKVVVWIAGSGNQIEIANFTATETTIDTLGLDKEEKSLFSQKYLDYVLADTMISEPRFREKIKNMGKRNEPYSSQYRKMYNWFPKVLLPKGYKLTYWSFMLANGEKEYILPGNNLVKKNHRALPYLFNMMFTDEDKNKYESDIVLTDDMNYLPSLQQDGLATNIPIDYEGNEIHKIFKERLNKLVNTVFEININPKNKKLTINLRQDKLNIPLNEIQFQIKNYGGSQIQHAQTDKSTIKPI